MKRGDKKQQLQSIAYALPFYVVLKSSLIFFGYSFLFGVLLLKFDFKQCDVCKYWRRHPQILVDCIHLYSTKMWKCHFEQHSKINSVMCQCNTLISHVLLICTIFFCLLLAAITTMEQDCVMSVKCWLLKLMGEMCHVYHVSSPKMNGKDVSCS